MDTDVVTAGSESKFTVASSSTQAERDAIEDFLNCNTSLAELLKSLGFHSKFLRGDARKIGPLILRQSAARLRSHNVHRFPQSIQEKLLSLNCGQLLAVIPEKAGVAESEKIAELLFDEFADDPIELGERIYKFTQYRKKPYEVFEKTASLYGEKYPEDPKIKNRVTAEFFASYFANARIADKHVASIMLRSIDHDNIVQLSNAFLTTVTPPHYEDKRFLESLDAETFGLIAELTILDEYERHSAGIIVPHIPFEEEWDLWLAQRMQRLIDSEKPIPPDGSDQSPIFSWDQFRKARDAFDPLSFPRTSAVLTHIGTQHFPTHIQDRVLGALESLELSPEYAPVAKIFVEAVVNDTQLLNSEGGRFLLEALEDNFCCKFPKDISKIIASQSLIYEIKLAGAIANANGLTLQPMTEGLISSDESSSVLYIHGGSPTKTFLDRAVADGKVETVIAIMEEIQSTTPNITLSEEQLEVLEGRFIGLVDETIQTGRSNTPGEVSADSFRQVVRLNELYPYLVAKLDLQTRPNLDNTTDTSQDLEFG